MHIYMVRSCVDLDRMLLVKSKKLGWVVISADGLVGYDTALTRQGSRVQFPLRVVVFIFLL